jgi:Flp pilus assembly protein TadG
MAVAFAIVAPVALGAMGMSIDYAQAYLVKQRLGNALDAAALAAAGYSSDENAIRQRVLDFFRANYPPKKVGFTFDPVVVVDGDEVIVTGNAQYHTIFVKFLGFDDIEISTDTVVQRQVQGIEVALVMDNTGSMASNNNIQALRTAAKNFVNIIFDAAENEQFVRIGLVPYSTSVNVGSYGLGLHPNGDIYGDPFVNNPNDYSYEASSNSEWGGCVQANGADTVDQQGPWDMYRYCRRLSDDYPTCDRYWHSWLGTYLARRPPNYICPRTSIMPLSNDRDDLLDHIATMQANGNTLGNYGMVWGYRILSPEFPFEEGSNWNSLYWKKAVIMMTDGVNIMHPTYSAYGRTSDHNIDSNDLNDKFAEVCDNMKDDNILIYTITFTSGVSDSTKNYYRNCASSPNQYYDAPSQQDLINVYESISRELSNLHIKS